MSATVGFVDVPLYAQCGKEYVRVGVLRSALEVVESSPGVLSLVPIFSSSEG